MNGNKLFLVALDVIWHSTQLPVVLELLMQYYIYIYISLYLYIALSHYLTARFEYGIQDLGPRVLDVGGKEYCRRDIVIPNPRKLKVSKINISIFVSVVSIIYLYLHVMSSVDS